MIKRLAILCAALMAASLLPGCAVVVSPKDGELQEAWDEAWEEVRRDLEEDLQNIGQEKDDFDGIWNGIFGDENGGESAKAHYWQILDAEGQEIGTAAAEADVAALDALFQGDSWKDLDFGGAGEKVEPLYIYVFWQEKTLLAGQDPGAERDYEEVIRFTVPAEGNEVSMLVLRGLEDVKTPDFLDLGGLLTIRITAPEETMESLRNPAQWSE